MQQAPALRLMFGGDAMLGRTVHEYIDRLGPGYPLGRIAPLLRDADLAIVNLECAITDSTRHWRGAPKAFYFGAPPAAAMSLAEAGIDAVSLANNHALDMDVRGLLDTLDALDRRGILHAGAGDDLAAARRPIVLERQGLRFGMAAFCDHQDDFAARAHHPGIAYLDLDDEAGALAAFAAALAPLRGQGVDWPILSLHWGPNMVWRPSPQFRKLAHAAIDMGWKMLFGHSAHVFHGIELRNGCPIIYAAGDLVDDYYVDREFRNDHQLLFELDLRGAQLERIVLHPLFIENCSVREADAGQAAWVCRQMRALCTEMGTQLRQEGDMLVADGARASAASQH
jgi:poly-gamma-glutamate capsule biosynthesis protein CapA/YwtB (metallophosphatase superfamily)